MEKLSKKFKIWTDYVICFAFLIIFEHFIACFLRVSIASKCSFNCSSDKAVDAAEYWPNFVLSKGFAKGFRDLVLLKVVWAVHQYDYWDYQKYIVH